MNAGPQNSPRPAAGASRRIRTAVTTETSPPSPPQPTRRRSRRPASPPGAAPPVLAGPVEFAVRETVVAAVAVHAAVAVPGVLRMEPGLSGLVTSVTRSIRQRLAGVDAAPTDGARVEIDGGRVWLDVSIGISGRDQAAAVGAAVQRAVIRAVEEFTGCPVAEAGVAILHIDPAGGAAGIMDVTGEELL